MKLHLTASAVRGKREEITARKGPASGAPSDAHASSEPASPSVPHLRLASARQWTHTLVLSGELDSRFATVLEREIEQLCEEGVTGITLDLRELTYIDPIVVAVIAFRSGLCKRRGFDFALIRGSQSVQRAFEQAGLADSLPFNDVAVPAPELTAVAHAQ